MFQPNSVPRTLRLPEFFFKEAPVFTKQVFWEYYMSSTVLGPKEAEIHEIEMALAPGNLRYYEDTDKLVRN